MRSCSRTSSRNRHNWQRSWRGPSRAGWYPEYRSDHPDPYTGKGRSIAPTITLKTAVLAPIASASVTRIVAVNPGELAKKRNACFTLAIKVSDGLGARTLCLARGRPQELARAAVLEALAGPNREPCRRGRRRITGPLVLRSHHALPRGGYACQPALSEPFGSPSLPPGTARSFPIKSSGFCATPSTAQAYSLNVTVIPPWASWVPDHLSAG